MPPLDSASTKVRQKLYSNSCKNSLFSNRSLLASLYLSPSWMNFIPLAQHLAGSSLGEEAARREPEAKVVRVRSARGDPTSISSFLWIFFVSPMWKP
ncbi:hypothetical protein L596_002222 [Steinernema carpocapsae]|uniref:Uncharacterized protein n=1 Tax=Steinernema carpocapsae TaxID=34508 RepID=A0A4U8UNN1_STECR|nr:hypothetical protein L596_002222 [Steinernema carpocapsae]